MLGLQFHLNRYKSKGIPKLVGGDLWPVSNSKELLPKADGGLWTSNFNPKCGSEWVDYCESVGIYQPEDDKWYGYILTPAKNAKILVIDSHEDYLDALQKYELKTELNLAIMKVLDFEKIACDYDAIHVTSNGVWESKYKIPSLWGWDVESTHWFRWKFTKMKEIVWESEKEPEHSESKNGI